MSYLFFVSYARDNRRGSLDESELQKFIFDLENEVRQLAPPQTSKLAFFDTAAIESGDEWPQTLAEALATSRICISLYSPTYFNSKWCGKEFQVFLDRRRHYLAERLNAAAPQARVLLPVIWIPPRELPVSVGPFQNKNDKYPKSYREGGLRQLIRLTKFHDDYNEFLTILAQEIVDAAVATPLPDLQPHPSLSSVANAFEVQSAMPGQPAPVTGGISKACFVFVAGRSQELQPHRKSLDFYGPSDGWEWRPFHPSIQETVGAMAQTIAGELGMRFQQIPCDDKLADALREAKRNHVPTLIVTDAWTLFVSPYAKAMSEYDDLNLSNCAVLMPWNNDDSETAAAQQQLRQLLFAVCPQKASSPPPAHLWDSITSMSDLRGRAKAALEELRLRLMQMLLTQTGATAIRKVENQLLSASAAQNGIPIEGQPTLQNVVGSKL